MRRSRFLGDKRHYLTAPLLLLDKLAAAKLTVVYNLPSFGSFSTAFECGAIASIYSLIGFDHKSREPPLET